MIADQVVHTVERQLQRLQSLPEHPKRAALAKLRKGIGRMPGDMPELWGAFCRGCLRNFKAGTEPQAGASGPSI